MLSYFKIILVSNMLIPMNLPMVEAPLKLLLRDGMKLCQCIFLMFSIFLNLILEMNSQFRKEEKSHKLALVSIEVNACTCIILCFAKTCCSRITETSFILFFSKLVLTCLDSNRDIITLLYNLHSSSFYYMNCLFHGKNA